ncbi:MAG: flagellin [Candidatus Hinthialibacter antarcticus]|nr:flagellin [Candidatus Hinthialibacter antarcticus]
MSITRINNNVAAIRATRNLNTNGDALAKNIERLSSGLRINRAGDDAAGLTIRERLRTQIRGTNQAIQNGQNGISMVNTTEASLDALVQSLQRIRELSIQAGNTGTLDSEAIQAIQEEVFQQIDEVNRIASTARFSNRLLFSGDNANKTEVKKGQDDLGVNVSKDPNASNLKSGISILNIVQTEAGSEKLLPFKEEDGQAFFATGIGDATDVAVSVGQFNLQAATTTAAARTTALNAITFDGVSTVTGDVIAFQGVLSDGVTPFAGSISVGTQTMANLETQIQTAVDNAETALFGGVATNIPGSFVQTHVSLAANGFTTAQGLGRMRFLSAQAAGTTTTTNASTTDAPSQFNINFTVITTAGVQRNSMGITRDYVQGQQVGAQIGNLSQAITGSTFSSGDFGIEVTDIVPPRRRETETTLGFRLRSGTVIDRSISLARTNDQVILNGTFVNGTFTTNDTGIALATGDTLTMQGINVDGTTFETIFTISQDPLTDTNLGDGTIATLGGLVDELNYRDRSRGVNGPNLQSGFQDSMLTVSGNGTLRLVDDEANFSKSGIFFTVKDQNTTRTVPDRGELIFDGTPETATIRIDGGPRQRVVIGDTLELLGQTPTKFGEAQERLVMRLGSGFRTAIDDAIFNRGTDTAAVIEKEFIGSLNGGATVTFQNGDSNVFFESGFSDGVAETIMLDFDAILDITGPPTDGSRNNGMAIQLTTTNNALNFQVGPFKGQDLQVNIPSLHGTSLGFGLDSGRTISNINVTTVEGANESLEIIDKALDQISRTRAALGAFTNRLETTIQSLSVASENLSASESRISDVDFAQEVSNFTSNQIIFQSGTSVLAQANFLPQNLLSLLG